MISLFSGAGGLDLGLEKAGFQVRVGVELDAVRVKTILSNMPHVHVIHRDIVRVNTSEILDAAGLRRGDVPLVAGGPPCQPFSKAAHWVRNHDPWQDPRAHLIMEYARVVKEARPMAFLMENVPGLAGKNGNGILSMFLKVLSKDYVISYKILDAVNYGVPQKRKRLFVIGFRKDLGITPEFPRPTHGPSIGRPFVTAGEAIGPLDDGIVEEDEIPRGKWGHLLAKIPPGMNYIWLTERYSKTPVFRYRSRYWSFLLKLHPEKPSWTIPAKPGPYTGPFHWRNRRLRICEIKRLQTFPDSWFLAGTKRDQWQQVGDAVPPLLAESIGKTIWKKLSKII